MTLDRQKFLANTTGSMALNAGQMVLNAVTGDKVAGGLQASEPALRAAGDAAGELQQFMYTAADYVSDGKLTWEEIFQDGGLVDRAESFEHATQLMLRAVQGKDGGDPTQPVQP